MPNENYFCEKYIKTCPIRGKIFVESNKKSNISCHRYDTFLSLSIMFRTYGTGNSDNFGSTKMSSLTGLNPFRVTLN